MGINLIRNFEEYVEKSNSATTEDQLFSLLLGAVKNHGLDRVLFCLATDHRDIGQNPGAAVIHNYPGDWMKYYMENDFDKIDPVMIYGLNQISSYTWDVIPQRMELKKKQRDCLNFGREAGLNDGVCTPLRGPNNQLAGLSFASSERKDGFDGNVDMITAYSNHFYIAWKRFHLSNKKTIEQSHVPNPVLTEKERDVLTWAAKGKTDLDIAEILNLSGHTVDWHMRNILKKLDANNRILAIVKAFSYGLIKP